MAFFKAGAGSGSEAATKQAESVPLGQPVHGNGQIDFLDATPDASKVDSPDPLAPQSPIKALDDVPDAPKASYYDSAKAFASSHKRGLAVGAGVVALGSIAAYGLTNRGDSDAPAGAGTGAGTGAGAGAGTGTGAGSYADSLSGQAPVTGNAPNNASGEYSSIPSGSVQSTSLVSSAYTNELKEAQALIATSNINKSLQEAQSFQQHFVSYPQAPTPSSTVPSDPAVASGKIVYS